MNNNVAIFIMGPTAVGKTALAVALASHLPVDLISVDSAMVYRGLDIGTGKPSVVELSLFPHKLIDICEPHEVYSVAQFCADAWSEMRKSWERGRIPLLVGGTMLYFKALRFGIAELPTANAGVRAQIMDEAQQAGWPELHRRLTQLDPEAAARLGIHDQQRIMRALEINILTGKSLQANFATQVRPDHNYKLHAFGLWPHSREELHQKIAARFADMLAAGLVEEVAMLMKRQEIHADLPAMKSVGYRQVWEYLADRCSYAEIEERAVAATRQLAKRQMTWLRSWQDITTIEGLKDRGGALVDVVMRAIEATA